MSVGEVSANSAGRVGGKHLHDVDVVRFTTVLGVLCVHATSLMLPDSEVSGAALIILHVTREVFLFLSAFVLAYSTPRPVATRSFWRRRFPLVVAPYALWSAIYLLADKNSGSSLGLLGRYSIDLLDAGARFHLYFLLLTFQLYLVFPWLRAWLARRSNHGRLLIGVAVWQLAFAAAIQYRIDLPAPLSTWLAHPGSWLPSYVLFVVAGVVAALHFDEVRSWVQARRRQVGRGALLVLVMALVSYELDVRVDHMSFLEASQVFSPTVVVESLAAIAAQFALGLWVVQWAGDRLLRLLRTTSDVSFGVYLAHPLLYQGFLAVLAAEGIHNGLGDLPAGVGLALVLVVIAPITYLLTATGIWLLRQTPASLIFTGRRHRRVAAPLSGPPRTRFFCFSRPHPLGRSRPTQKGSSHVLHPARPSPAQRQAPSQRPDHGHRLRDAHRRLR